MAKPPSKKRTTRPFMRPTVIARRKAWMTQLGAGAKAVLEGRAKPADVLETVAMGAAGDVAKTIRSVTSPPLNKRTIARKGFDKPLVETRQMIQSVTGVVEKKGGG